MHILFLTDNFPPEGNAPASRTYEHALRWVQLGNSVTVITCAPNFPEGKVFAGYANSWHQRSKLDGIDVVRVKTYITANEGFFRRTLDYMSFMISGFIAGLFQRKPDVIVATSPQFFCACAGWALSVFKRKPFVFELRDIWPASITAVGAMKQSKVIWLLEKLEMFLYRRASMIVSVTNSFKKELVERGIPAEKIEVVLNGVDLSKFQPVSDKNPVVLDKFGLSANSFVAGYIGTHGMAHALEHVVAAAAMLRNNMDIHFLFVGGGAARQKIVDLVSSEALKNVTLIDRQSKEMMPMIWSLCDVSIVPLKNTPLFSSVIPSKIFECMGMAIPMILSIPEGEATSIVRETDTGIIVCPESPEELEGAIMRLANDKKYYSELASNCKKVANKFDRSSQADIMLHKLEKLVAGY